ncbi:MAG: Asp-tRNA(Asn)/Glu-tRNA(Gln) amidotransferase subunit GatB [Fimbriimonadaceae bacterium]|nr:Asp-tRNA(Asn)/Glu-tRNA(Gln) amidotransferase subunit GatB [Fimbriimonadaceae bacterium]
MGSYVLSVGVEVHAELRTNSKMFCRCQVAFGGEANTRTCPICLGMPGTLPVPNAAAIEMVLKTALALNCQVPERSVFHRKNYFYPDLPKGFQVSQYEETNPIGYHGYLDIETSAGTKRIGIKRVHLEEDTGKLLHMPGGGSGIDFNRAGVPLMEIVTDFPPDIHSAEEAKEYASQLRQLLVWLGVCDGKMEEGSLRAEPNISVAPVGADKLGTKTELKNLGSFRSVHLGVEFEERRQIAVLETGGKILQETRGWNEGTESSYLMRTKETEQDYRYFPCPDLVPLEFSREYVESVREQLPELPLARKKRYIESLGLSAQDAALLIADRDWSGWFEECVSRGGEAKAICNWMNGDFARLLNETGQVAWLQSEHPEGREISSVTPAHLVELTTLIADGTISGKTAKDIFEQVFREGVMPSKLAEGQKQISDGDFIAGVVAEAIDENPGPVEQFRGGKEGVLGFLVGQVMKKTQGRANAPMVQAEVRRQLEAE